MDTSYAAGYDVCQHMQNLTTNGHARIEGHQIRKLMRARKVTIRDLAARMGITMKRVRMFRDAGIDSAFSARDTVQAITGCDPGAHARAWVDIELNSRL